MALQRISVVQPQDDVHTKKAKSGGRGIGTAIGAVGGGILGGLAGAAATVGTAGAGAPAIGMGVLAGSAAGAGVGGQIGEWVDPARGESTAITRRMQAPGLQQTQSDSSEKLKQSILALQSQPDHIKAEYTRPLVEAYVTSLAQEQQYTA